jgi:hypothetical protein
MILTKVNSLNDSEKPQLLGPHTKNNELVLIV